MIVSKKAPGKKSITLVMNGWCVLFRSQIMQGMTHEIPAYTGSSYL
jgi:hypothetical protein